VARGELTLIPIDRQRAARLGATRAFAYFVLTVDRHALCAGDVRLAGRTVIPASTRLLSAADRVPHARALCEPPPAPNWLTETFAVLRSVFRI
jgi:hypothetical protein